jgi:hypothetical protein
MTTEAKQVRGLSPTLLLPSGKVRFGGNWTVMREKLKQLLVRVWESSLVR